MLIMMDINYHPLQNKFYTQLQEKNTELEEFTHKCWGTNKPYTHHSGKTPIDGGYKTPEVKIVNLAILTFAESPGDHQSFILDVSVTPHMVTNSFQEQAVPIWEIFVFPNGILGGPCLVNIVNKAKATHKACLLAKGMEVNFFTP